MLPNINGIQESVLTGATLFLPELLVCGGIVLLLLLRLFRLFDRAHLGLIALVLTLAALGVAVCQWGGYSGFKAPEETGRSADEYDLRLMFDLKDVSDIPTEDKNRVIVADVNRLLHFRIFDIAGKMVVDTDENRLPAQAGPINKLREQLQKLRPPHELSRSEKAEVVTTVTSIVGHTPADLMFGGLLVYDHLTVFLRCFLLAFAALMIWLTMLTGIPDREDSADFYCLLLGATLGMSLMASANHLLMVFIGVEMASLPSYALAGFLKGRRLSSEAALKYVVYGGGAAGVMLYGISLLAGKFGTGYLPDLAAGYVHAAQTFDPVLILGTLFLLIGVAFKLAAVPFHFWCPDVFEGASAEVAGFLSVASKAAALALLARLTLVFAGADPLVASGGNWIVVLRYLIPALAVFAGVTATFGNLAAFLQNNLKRLLAYSTIAHAGYMMMGLCALTTPRLYLAGDRAVVGAQAVLFYLIAYLFMNLGAFAVVAFLRNQTGTEDLDRMRGLVRRSPWMVVTLSVFLLSLLGIPPLIGFTAKFQIFYSLWSAGQFYYQAGETGLGFTLVALLAVGGANSVLSAVYYLKVMKVMIIEGRAEDLEGGQPARLSEPAGAVFYATALALVVLGLGLAWNPLSEVSKRGVERFRPRPVAAAAPSGAEADAAGTRRGGPQAGLVLENEP